MSDGLCCQSDGHLLRKTYDYMLSSRLLRNCEAPTLTIMPGHRCNYCLKPIVTAPGVKRHISQSPACRQQWRKLLERTTVTATEDKVDQSNDNILDNTPEVDASYQWADDVHMGYSSDGAISQEGHMIIESRYREDSGPSELHDPPPKRPQVEDDIEDAEASMPPTGRFTEQLADITAKILGSAKTVFERLEEEELAKEETEWAPFQDEEEWEVAKFLMKNLGQKKMDEFLDLPLVCDETY